MQPLYDRNCNLVAWLDEEEKIYIFDTNMNWIAFVCKHNVFTTKNAKWLGPVKNGTFFDTKGQVVLWNPDSPIESIGTPNAPYPPYIPYTPYRPARPYTPATPYTPGTPRNGWSKLTVSDWASE
ncbi:4-fold beta flower protein [Bacillus gaemokensis]|uniref:4-fold beta flower protein n=1 Tax=Bacillus gaemokensis TaxID=574375 RepID=UPI0005353067|nr:hypothetical protein [Bacillus gaemokensis]KYG35594.1 hypothetical protein AZF08_26325 [Bacillus gaemokensis]